MEKYDDDSDYAPAHDPMDVSERVGRAVVPPTRHSDHDQSPSKRRRLENGRVENIIAAPAAGVGDTSTLICVDTTGDLKHKMSANKKERQERRVERKIANNVREHDLKTRKNMLDRLNDLNIEEAANGLPPPMVPGNGATKTAFGRRVVHTRNPSEDELIRADLDRLPLVDEIDEDKLAEYNQIHRASLGLKNIGEHIMGARSFVEHRPTQTVKVRVKGASGGGKSGTPGAATSSVTTVVVVQSDTAKINRTMTEHDKDSLAHGWTSEMTKSMLPILSAVKEHARAQRVDEYADTEPVEKAVARPDAEVDMDIDYPVTQKVGAAADKKAALGGNTSKGRGKKAAVKLSRAQIAVTEQRGHRPITEDDASFLAAAGEVRAIKPKPVRYEYSKFTETPPSGNDNVRLARLDLVESAHLFDDEAARAVDPQTASVPSHLQGALRRHINEKESQLDPVASVATSLMAGMEQRHVTVVDEAFFEQSRTDPAQQTLLRKGDLLALDMADKRYRKSRLPSEPIDDLTMRELEQGREPISLAVENARLKEYMPEQLRDANLPLVVVDKNSPHQPLYRYFEMFGKTSRMSSEDMIEELIYDKKRVIASAANIELIYALDMPDDAGKKVVKPDGEVTEMRLVDAMGIPAKVNPETGLKITHKQMAQRTRSIKRQRDVFGRQAEADPPRLRSRIPEARVAFFLERWNRRDRLFMRDYPALFHIDAQDTDAMDIDAATDNGAGAAAAKTDKQSLESETKFGPLGKLLARHRTDIAERGKMTGASYFVSSEDLAGSRLHPSNNPSQERVSLRYREAQMEQPRKGEEPCANMRECVAYRSNIMRIDNATYFSPTNSVGFVCKVWYTPKQRARFELDGKTPPGRRCCILCLDDERTRFVYDCQRLGISVTQPIHDHCVYVNKEGEYATEQLLPASWRMAAGRQVLTGIVDAYPAFNEADYVHDVRVEDDGTIIRFIRYRPPRSGF